MQKNRLAFLLASSLLGLIVVGQASAQETQSLMKIAVLDLGDKGVGGQVVSLVPSVITHQLSTYGLFDVLSREEIRKMLSHEQDKMLMGCDDASCMAEIGGALGAEALVTGDLGKVGDKILINLQLIDIRNAKVIKRNSREVTGGPGQLLDEVRVATHGLVEGLLKAASGKLLFSVSEEGADISVDGNVVGVSPMPSMALPAGPHDVRVKKGGFVSWARTVPIQPNATEMVEVNLIPSANFIEAYEDKASGMRRWAWITAAGFLVFEGAALGLRLFTWQKYDPIVDDYNDENFGTYADAQSYYEHYKDDIKLADTLDYTALGLAVTGAVLGGISLYFFLEGEDPDHYEQFRGIQGEDSRSAVKAEFLPLPGGGAVAVGWDF